MAKGRDGEVVAKPPNRAVSSSLAESMERRLGANRGACDDVIIEIRFRGTSYL